MHRESRSVNSGLGIVLRWCKYFRTAFEGSMHFRSSSFAFRSLPTLSLSVSLSSNVSRLRRGSTHLSRCMNRASCNAISFQMIRFHSTRIKVFLRVKHAKPNIPSSDTGAHFVQRVFNYFAKRLNPLTDRYSNSIHEAMKTRLLPFIDIFKKSSRQRYSVLTSSCTVTEN